MSDISTNKIHTKEKNPKEKKSILSTIMRGAFKDNN